ncbi:hypothetical protein G1H11_17675 [Phytoactinopolyspora alkaliphila]|uniref:HNH nuclease domain-containing protein n=1 Tax=Phytoactinopolyspora alkaliphila TaxID=1783498 RepID=A0A6N9YQ00_9ACTN|nr:RHS repeat-associated core domain-containing protein [Phytoactinopolyspora alkaliphila]NED97131.1 hypothetical protein [Phytoactinopolyspora alkaliphila]
MKSPVRKALSTATYGFIACAAALLVIVSGLPADEPAAALESQFGPELDDEDALERRRAEETGEWNADRPKPEETDTVDVQPVTPKTPKRVSGERPQRGRPGVEWPKAGSARVDLKQGATNEQADPTSRRGIKAGALPFWLTPSDQVANGKDSDSNPPETVDVELIPAETVERDGVHVAFSVEAVDDTNVSEEESSSSRHETHAEFETAPSERANANNDDDAALDVTVDYSGFAHATGGDFGSRLTARVYDLDCYLSGDACTPVPAEPANDPAESTVTTTVPTPSSGFVVALVADASGPAGDYAATSLSPASSWEAGGSSGDFTWSYPLRTPDTAGGLSPELSLRYSSGSVDGRVTSTNNQPSWIGEGFELDSGYVERRYVPCADDMGSGANNTVKTGDLCWKTDNAVLMLAGTTTELVKDSTTGQWRPLHDDGSRVEHLTGASNGARNGEHWRVTTTDGTEYYFGKHKRYSADTAETNSVFTVPVAGNHSGEPCRASAFKDSFCQQAWRWNLDYVIDPNGNTMTYFYERETNRYGQNLNDTSVSYTRGGYLKRIEYGQRAGTEHTTPALARVVFAVSERCLPSGTITCAEAQLTESNADHWPDVPFDQICTSTTSCSERVSPTFFSRKRLTRMQTWIYNGSVNQTVDRWDFTHDFPDPGDDTSAALWLDAVEHSGRAGTAVTMPKVTFDGAQMANRVDGIDNAPPLNKWRIRAVHTESGATTSVNYSSQQCSPSSVPSNAHTNNKRCFPVYWTPDGMIEPELHWFHKYVVDSVIETDNVGNGVDVESHYTYHGDAAWAYTDSELIQEDRRTWGQWRGYGKVTVRGGNPSTDQLRTEYLYLRGMHGDRATPSGGTRSVSVTDSWNDAVTDHKHLAGFTREVIAYDGSQVVSSTVNDPWRSSITATDGNDEARMVNIAATREHTKLAAGGWRTTELTTTYDEHGLAVTTNDRGDTSITSDDLCTRTEYAKNLNKWILDAVKRTETVSIRCSETPSRPGDVVSDERFSYDGGVYGSTPTRGNVTRTQELNSWSSGPSYVTTSTTVYDVHGRVTETKDALNRSTKTQYSPSTGGPVTQIKTINPAGHSSTATINPRQGQPVTIVDSNGKRTDLTYDALRRLTHVWHADRSKANGDTASTQYIYRVSKTAPAAVTTKELLPSGDYATSVTLYDGLLRSRQSQSPAQGDNGGRVITKITYDSRGLVSEALGPYYATGAPATTLVTPTTTVPARSVVKHDGAGRPVRDTFYVHQDEKWRTVTAYEGDRVKVTPPAGSPATTTITDARGRTIEARRHHGVTPSGPFDGITYDYTPAGLLEGVTDQAGNEWSYAYDLRGRRTHVDDPDAGLNVTTYDHASQVTSVTDARGESLHYTYDTLGRKTRTREGSPTGNLIASWTFDTLAKGQLTSSTSFVDGAAYITAITGYDNAYRPTGTQVTIPSQEGQLAGTYSSIRTYFPDGSVRAQTAPAKGGLPQETLWHYYDDNGAPEWLFGQRTYVADTIYTPFGETEQYSLGVNYGRANWQTFTYEEGTRRLSTVRVDREGVDPSDIDRAYHYDATGNPQSIIDTGGTGANDVQCFTYDHQRRLADAWTQSSTSCATAPTSAVVGGAAPSWQSYTYDTAGNRVTMTEHGIGTDPTTTSTYTYPSPGAEQPHALATRSTQSGNSPADVTTFTYDDAGNTTDVVTGTETTSYEWDSSGRLAGITTPDGEGENIYTADGARLIRRTPDTTTLYVGTDEYTLTHANNVVSGTRYYTHAGAVLVVRESDGTITSLATDAGGTPIAAIDANNAITQRWNDAFGNPRGDEPLFWPGDRGFHTGTSDEFSGLVRMGARHYDPALGRFLTVDPLLDVTDTQQINGYTYANNNPLAYTDPNGLSPNQMHDGGPYARTPGSQLKTLVNRYKRAISQRLAEVTRRTAVSRPAYRPVTRPSSTSSRARRSQTISTLAQSPAHGLRLGMGGEEYMRQRASLPYNPAALYQYHERARIAAGIETGAALLPMAPDPFIVAGDILGINDIIACGTEGQVDSCAWAAAGAVPGLGWVARGLRVAKPTIKATPSIKPGSAGGPTASQKFPERVRQEELADNPSTCVYCRMETDRPQVDHAIPRSRGGNSTRDNAQTTCAHCNASKGARDFPVTPPEGFAGAWPPPWWGVP